MIRKNIIRNTQSASLNNLLRELRINSQETFEKNSKLPVQNRGNIYDFRWRMILEKYKWDVIDQEILENLKNFFADYEDYLLKSRFGGLYDWPKDAKEKYDYLTKHLVNPWYIEAHPQRLFTIKNPVNITFFRAIDLPQLFLALDFCYQGANGPVKSLSRINGLKWEDCVMEYNHKMSKGRSYWTKNDLDISLLIADKIIRTFDNKTGLWQTGGNKWALLVLQKLTIDKNTRFQDIVNIVSQASIVSVSKGVYAIALFWGVGGSKAVNVIKGAYYRNNIPKWW
jgi:hypothetical protein